MIKQKKGMLIAAGLLAGAAALTGCSAQTTPVVTPTPNAAQKVTAQPATVQPDAGDAEPTPEESASAEETPAPISLRVNGEELAAHALKEEGEILLPLTETAHVLGWTAEEETIREETQDRHSIVLTKDDSRISVSYTISDNTIRRITWQKDGLLIPVDTKIRVSDGQTYVPAAFFEEAMDLRISAWEGGVDLSTPQPLATADMAVGQG